MRNMYNYMIIVCSFKTNVCLPYSLVKGLTADGTTICNKLATSVWCKSNPSYNFASKLFQGCKLPVTHPFNECMLSKSALRSEILISLIQVYHTCTSKHQPVTFTLSGYLGVGNPPIKILGKFVTKFESHH